MTGTHVYTGGIATAGHSPADTFDKLIAHGVATNNTNDVISPYGVYYEGWIFFRYVLIGNAWLW